MCYEYTTYGGLRDLERAIGGDQNVDPQIEFLAPHQQRVFDVSGDGQTVLKECVERVWVERVCREGLLRVCVSRGFDQRVGCEGV